MISPLISVLLVNYNHEKHLEASIQSVLNQTYRNIHFIIVDDGSTDNSPNIIENYCQMDSRIEYIPMPQNKHISHATNVGFSKVKGDYLARIDSDDVWHLNKLETQLQFMDNNPTCNICFSWIDIIDENDNNINEEQKDLLTLYSSHTQSQEDWLRFFFFYGNCLCHASVLMRTKIMFETGLFNLAFRQIHDFDYWVRISKKHQIYIIDKPLLSLRRFVNSDMKNNSSYDEVDMTRYFNEYMIMKYHFFDEMDDELFIRTFSLSFRNSSSASLEELTIEKAFLLFHCYQNGLQLPILGLMKLEELLHDQTYVDLLENKYNFTAKNYYDISCNHMFCDSFVNSATAEVEGFKKQIADQNSQIVSLLKKQAEYKNALETIMSSSCWKFTKPLRTLLDKLK